MARILKDSKKKFPGHGGLLLDVVDQFKKLFPGGPAPRMVRGYRREYPLSSGGAPYIAPQHRHDPYFTKRGKRRLVHWQDGRVEVINRKTGKRMKNSPINQ